MSYVWQDILTILQNNKTEFDKSFKCLNKANLPSERTQIKHLKILIKCHNDLIALIRKIFKNLSTQHREEIKSSVFTIKNKLEILLARLSISVNVPRNISDIITVRFKEQSATSSDSDTETEPESKNDTLLLPQTPNQPESETSTGDEDSKSLDFEHNSEQKISEMTPAEFLNLAAKLIPEFNSTADALPKFLNALDLVESLKESNESIAVSLIKTKISGKAQNIVSTLTTIASIKNALKTNISGESAMAVTAKLMASKQNSKDSASFVKDIEELSQQLENAYIADGLPTTTAQKYATQVAIKSLAQNARSSETRIVMKAGNFNSVSEAVTKFVDASAEASTSQINFIQRNRFSNYRANYRGRNRGYYNNNRGRYNNNPRYSNNQNRGAYNQNRERGRNSQNNRYGNPSNRGGQQRQNIRAIEASPENRTDPQLDLGEFFENQ